MADPTASHTPGNIELFQYEAAEIRTVDLPGLGRYAVAADICRALDIKDVSDAVSRLDKADRASTPIRSGAQNRNMWVVSENGATDLVLDSRKPEARAFRRFLTHEVWPSIRDTGSYSTAPALTGSELLAAAVLEAQSMIAAKDAQIAELEPKANYVDVFVADSDLMSIRTVASTLDVQETWLRAELVTRKWIYAEHSSRWSETKGMKVNITRYSEYADKKVYFQRVENHDAPRFRGEVMHTLKVTAAGANAISRMVPRWAVGDAA